MSNLQERLRQFQEWESHRLLNELMLKLKQVAVAENEEEGRKQLAAELLQLCELRLGESQKLLMEVEKRKHTVHLVFSMSDAGSLKVALSDLGRRNENEVLSFNDFFSIGPIKGIDQQNGQLNRQQWLMNRLPSHLYFNEMHNRDHQIGAMALKLAEIPEHKSIVIWYADNAHDQVGLRLALHLLKGREQPVSIVNISKACKEVSSNSDGEEGKPPYAQGVLPLDMYREIVKQKEHVVPLNAEERRQFEREWLALSEQEHTLRLWRNDAIAGVPDNELDEIILAMVLKLQQSNDAEDGFIKTGIVVGEIFENVHQLISDSFIEYRIWTLISNGILTFKGLPGAMYMYSIRVN